VRKNSKNPLTSLMHFTKESLQKGKMSTVDLLVVTSSNRVLFNTDCFTFLQNKLLNEEVKCTEPSPSVRFP